LETRDEVMALFEKAAYEPVPWMTCSFVRFLPEI
jgi:hypothetical protein